MDPRGFMRGPRGGRIEGGRHGGPEEERHGRHDEGRHAGRTGAAPEFEHGGRTGRPWGWGGPEGRSPFGGFPGRRFGHGHHAGRGDVRSAALALLTEGPRHGYQIIQEIGERSGGTWQPSPGSVYPALQLLEDEGLIRAEQADSRRVFQLTEAGRAYVAEHAAELTAVWNAVADTVDNGMVELRALYAQVGAAVRQVAHAGTRAEVAEARQLLTGTRRQLYRILAGGEPAGQAPGTGEAGQAGDV